MLKEFKNIAKAAAYFTSGMFGGLIVGLLVAPKSGKDLRRDLRNKSSELKEEVKCKIQEVEDKGLSQIRKVGHVIRDKADKLWLKPDNTGNKNEKTPNISDSTPREENLVRHY